MNILLIILYIVFAVGGSTLIKFGGTVKSAALLTVPVVNVSISPISLAGILFYGMSFLFYIFLLNRMELSVLSPVTIGVVYVLLMVTAAIVFGEQFTVVKTIGCVMILAGVIMVLTAAK